MYSFGILVILPFISLGSLLPTWIFINSLSLLAHLPLLNTNMPGNVHIFLTDYLDKVRWYDEDFIETIEESYEFKKYDIDVGSFHKLLKVCGYEHLVTRNLLIVFAAMVLILFIWILMAIKDVIVKLS